MDLFDRSCVCDFVFQVLAEREKLRRCGRKAIVALMQTRKHFLMSSTLNIVEICID